MNGLLLAAVALMNVTFEAPLVVSEFLDSNAFVRVIHGPVGSGKSSGCVVEILRRALEQAPDASGVRDTRWAVVRNTYRELEDTTRQTFEQWLGPLGEMKEEDFAFHIDRPLEDGTRLKCEVLFRALDKPKDVKKVLSLEITGAYVNELREVPKLILDGLTMRVGRYPAKKDGGATWSGVWADTNPWAETSEYAELFAEPPEGFTLFRQPDALGPEAENRENLPDGYYERMCAGKDSEWVDEYVRGKNPKSDKGSIYGEKLAELKARGGISAFRHPTDGVNVTFDLGISDSTSMWFWRLNEHGVPDFVDWYEASGKALSHFFAILRGEVPPGVDRARKYEIAKVYLPHDARARTLQTGVSTIQLFIDELGMERVEIALELDPEQGIAAFRWMLEQPTRFHVRTEEGLKRLRAYRYVWDETKKVFSKTPLHDWTSHTADSARYVACTVHGAWLERQASEPKKPKAKSLPPVAPTMDELWAETEGDEPRTERI
jgi:hypothetical protein